MLPSGRRSCTVSDSRAMVAPVDSGVSTVMTGTGTLAGNLEVKVWRIVLDLDLPRRRPFRKNFENNPESLLWPFPDPWSRSTSERLTSVVLLELALWCTFHVTLRNLDEEAGVGRSLGGKTVILRDLLEYEKIERC